MNPLHYLKFFLFHFVGLLAVLSLLAGGPWTTGGLLAVLAFYLIGDAFAGTTPAPHASSTRPSSPPSSGWPCHCWA